MSSNPKHAVNVSTPERVGRVILGVALAAVGVIILVGSPAALGAIGAALLIAVGIDFIVTGSTGYCPLYARLGHVLRSPHGSAR